MKKRAPFAIYWNKQTDFVFFEFAAVRARAYFLRSAPVAAALSRNACCMAVSSFCDANSASKTVAPPAAAAPAPPPKPKALPDDDSDEMGIQPPP